MATKKLGPYNTRVVVKYLKDHNDIPMKILEIKEKLPIKIKRKEILHILNDLENEGKIITGGKGFLWIYNNSKKLKRMIKNGLEL